jgi:single-strand DNA-binding protein
LLDSLPDIFFGGIMNNLNSILIEGNLVRDPLYRTTPKGTPLCTFTLASNRFFKQDSGLEKEVGFFDVESWAKLAENCNNLGRKGRGVRVVGRLKQERWNGSDGKAHSKIAIVAEHVEFKPEFRKNDKADNGEASAMADAALDSPDGMIPQEGNFDEDSAAQEFANAAEEHQAVTF